MQKQSLQTIDFAFGTALEDKKRPSSSHTVNEEEKGLPGSCGTGYGTRKGKSFITIGLEWKVLREGATEKLPGYYESFSVLCGWDPLSSFKEP